MSLLSSLTPLIVGVIVLGVIVEAIPAGKRGRRSARRPVRLAAEPAPLIVAKPLMTANERQFWQRLRVAAAPLHVAPQVAMGALIDVESGPSQSARTSERNGFDRQIVDFVLIDDMGRVQLLVELDDNSHARDRDERRDFRTAQAGYLTLRVRGQPGVEQLRGLIAERVAAAGVYPSSRAASRA